MNMNRRNDITLKRPGIDDSIVLTNIFIDLILLTDLRGFNTLKVLITVKLGRLGINPIKADNTTIKSNTFHESLK